MRRQTTIIFLVLHFLPLCNSFNNRTYKYRSHLYKDKIVKTVENENILRINFDELNIKWKGYIHNYF